MELFNVVVQLKSNSIKVGRFFGHDSYFIELHQECGRFHLATESVMQFLAEVGQHLVNLDVIQLAVGLRAHVER